MAVISTRIPFGSAATAMAVRAGSGRSEVKKVAYSRFIAAAGRP
jgi:hypothetical protein